LASSTAHSDDKGEAEACHFTFETTGKVTYDGWAKVVGV
jgi:hypothetical protein